MIAGNVITLGLTVLTIEQVLLTVVAMYINVKVMDFMIEGMNPKKAITIISKNPEKKETKEESSEEETVEGTCRDKRIDPDQTVSISIHLINFI